MPYHLGRHVSAIQASGFLACAVVLIATASSEPKLADATLEWRGHVLRPKHVATPWLPSFRAGPHLLTLDGAMVTALDPVTRTLHWTAIAPKTTQLAWLGADGDVAYFVSRDTPSGDGAKLADPRVFALDLRDGSWRRDLVVPHGSEAELVLGLAACPGLVAVVSATIVTPSEWPREPQMVRYQVTGLDPDTAAQKWSRSFDASSEGGDLGPLLYAARRPNETVPGLRAISAIGDNLIVCAGSRQDVVCLEGDTGTTRWIKSHLWEFDRGFIGPSVWSHFMGRFGERRFGEGKDSVDPAVRAAFDERWTCAIVGGPIVVPRENDDRWMGGRHRIFVAVARAPAGTWASHLSQCIVYELDEEGEIWTMATLPRMVIGSETSTVTGAVNWIMQNNAQARLQIATEGAGFSPGSSDLVTKVSWYREFDAIEPKAWLVVDKPRDPAVFSSAHAFRVFTGGYVDRADECVFHLPVAAVECATGACELLLLHVPLTGPVPLPEQNVRISEDESSCHTWGPYFLGITGLRADGDRLAITIGMEKWSAELTFHLGESP
jgi:hypothetical protein